MSNLKINQTLQPVLCSNSGVSRREKLYQNTLDYRVIFSDNFTNCLNALDVEKPTRKAVFQRARCSPKRWLQYCTVGLAKMSRYHIQFEGQSEIAQQQLNTCEKEKEEGRGRQKGEWGKPSLTVYSAKDLNCRKEEPCQQMPNQCGTCQTAPYPSQSAKKLSPAWFLLPHQ